MNTTSIFFNHSFDKKRLKAFLYWVLKTFGEKEALIIVEQLKSMGFDNATKAGLSIGLHDLKTPFKKRFLISRAQITMNKTDQEFRGAEVTATERSQRIIDTWHRTSEDLRKQVVDYFSTYDQLNSVYMMALSGARGNFSQVRQLIGMRGLMADPQGQIISFPIRSNLREGLTLTEYFISCSGARKGLVDTALRTADTGYLTRRLVDISHHVVVKKVSCYTSRGIALKTLRTSQKILLPLRDRLIGRVLAENIYVDSTKTEFLHNSVFVTQDIDNKTFKRNQAVIKQNKQIDQNKDIGTSLRLRSCIAKKNQEISPDLAFKISLARPFQNSVLPQQGNKTEGTVMQETVRTNRAKLCITAPSVSQNLFVKKSMTNLSSSQVSDQVLVRSPLTCTYTHELCQLCYGWSMAQGSLVSLGEAVGVIAGQSIGEPGTQLTMRTFHTGGVFSGDLLQEIRAPHSGKILFPKALQGLLIRTSQGKIAFLIKVSGELLVENTILDGQAKTNKTTKVPLAPSTILFVRQGEKVKSHQILAELAITTEEGNQPIKSRQTLFSEIKGRIVQWKSMSSRMHRIKGAAKVYKNEVFPPTNTNLVGGKTESKVQLSKQGFVNKASLSYTQIKEKLSVNSNKVKREQSFLTLLERNSHHYQEKWRHLNNLTLKKVVLEKKHGLGSVEPPQALKLGLLSVIATRIGASEKTCTRLVTSNGVTSSLITRTEIDDHPLLCSDTQITNLQYLDTVAKKGDLVDEKYNKLSFCKKALHGM